MPAGWTGREAGSLGRLEELACRLAALTGRPVPPCRGEPPLSVAVGHAPRVRGELGPRLGESSVATWAFGLVDATLRVLHELATFTAAGVTDIPPPVR